MRIKSIELSWFRGASSSISLETGGKSVVVYGSNGSGKSSFADALEYVIANGKIAHLAHEYSGSRQLEGIRNTHAPEEMPTYVKISCQDNQVLTASITAKGRYSVKGDPPDTKDLFQCFDLERFILRQDEVAKFIHATKGQKYSVLLPLLGLDQLETAADNLTSLKKAVESRGELTKKTQQLEALHARVRSSLPDLAHETLTETIHRLAAKYLPQDGSQDLQEAAASIREAINKRIELIEPEHTKHLLLKQLLDLDLPTSLNRLASLEEKTTTAAAALVDRQIAVLESAERYIEQIDHEHETVSCPACGQEVSTQAFQSHVQTELDSLNALRALRDEQIKTRQEVQTGVTQIKRISTDPVISAWLLEPEQIEMLAAFEEISRLDLGDGRSPWETEVRNTLQDKLPAFYAALHTAAASAPPSVQDLLEDREIVDVYQLLPEITRLEGQIEKIQQLAADLSEAATGVREALKQQTKQTIEAVSVDVQQLWSKLHPAEPIEDVQLYIPGDVDKAIDISLKFFGVDQSSPRISLSEGHRNSLGLCIFLALVKQPEVAERPIVLDDVISSMDREHRGRLANILLEDLAVRQVIVLTHDREWFTELRARLSAKQWQFLALKPWQDPALGIQWSQSTGSFDDARALIEVNPLAAGNRARATMDTEMAIVSEKLRVPVPFARGDRNDHRTCVEFLQRVRSMSAKAMRKKQGDAWPTYDLPLTDWEEAQNLLVSWGNRSSHTGTLTQSEAEELIQVCEKALTHFRCEACGDPIWIADQANRNRLQCSCGTYQWRY